MSKTFDLSTLNLSAGTHEITVKARASGYEDSPASNAVSYVVDESLTPTEGLSYTLSDDGTYYTCTGIGTATDTDIVIASEINGIPVTVIGEDAFNGANILPKLTSVVIGNSVTSIGKGAFNNCYSLTSVVIGDSVTSIGDYAFRNCHLLQNVAIPNSVISIGYGAFQYCFAFTSVVIGGSVIVIGSAAFHNCSNLTSVSIGSGVTSIGERLFSMCTSLTSITYDGTIAQWKSISKGLDWFVDVPATTISCTDGATPVLNVFAFTIDGTTCYAEEDMTWAQWCESAYNTKNLTINEQDEVINPNNAGGAMYLSGVFGSDRIKENGVYKHTTVHGGGSN